MTAPRVAQGPLADEECPLTTEAMSAGGTKAETVRSLITAKMIATFVNGAVMQVLEEEGTQVYEVHDVVEEEESVEGALEPPSSPSRPRAPSSPLRSHFEFQASRRTVEQ